MGESAAPGTADGEASTSDSATSADGHVVLVADKGDIILDVTFETSEQTLKRSRKVAALAAKRKPTNGNGIQPPAVFRPRVKVAYRTSLELLKKHSKYFDNLLTNPQFREAKVITDAHRKLADRKVNPGEAEAHDLPRIMIVDDDEATQTAGRENAFEDMLRIIHQKPAKTTRLVMSYVTTLAIFADRFDCAPVVSRALTTELKFKWPATNTKPYLDDAGRLTDAEKILRQKILVAWLLGQPLKLHQSSRELVLRGSRLWGAYAMEDTSDVTAVWWNLPEGIEEELQYRRDCILNTIASVQSHFLSLYGSRERQCTLGYDSSAACDSFQFGQMLKFLMSKDLLFLVDFSAASLDNLPDKSLIDIDELLTTLKKSPNYQIDKYHTNCGLRIRIEPILDYIRAMLSANVISIPHADWKKRRADMSWLSSTRNSSRDEDGEDGKPTFAFTRALANDQRLRYEGALYADRMARTLFTANSWDWTPDYDAGSNSAFTKERRMITPSCPTMKTMF